MSPKPLLLAAMLLAAPVLTPPVTAQGQSEGYKFLQAVRDAKNDEVLAMLGRPGATPINARDVSTGETALHIVVRRGDATYTRYLLSKGADANLRDGKGNTPLLLAAQLSQADLIPILVAGKANPNLANASGETPLIRAVQQRNLPTVRALLAAKADPDQTDNVAGMSARDYAAQDSRYPALAKLIADTPKRARAAVSGPRL
jgi:ankyrin repeat protein